MVRFCLAFLLLASSAFGQLDVTFKSAFRIDGLTDTQPIAGMIVSSTSATSSTPIGFLEIKTEASELEVEFVDASSGLPVQISETSPGSKLYSWTSPGSVSVKVDAFDWDKRIRKKWSGICSLPGVPTPGPKPDPKPDDPTVVKIADPSILIVYESRDLPAYPANVKGVMNSTELTLWARNNKYGLAVLDKNTPFPTNCDAVWCKWLANPPPELPWVIIGNKSKIVHSGKLPSSVKDLQDLAARYKQ
jgi:hypothetical protein